MGIFQYAFADARFESFVHGGTSFGCVIIIPDKQRIVNVFMRWILVKSCSRVV